MKQLRPITPITILAAELGEIITDNAKELASNPEILQRLKRCKDLASGLDPYIELHTSAESDDLRRLNEATLSFDWDDRDGDTYVKGLEAEMLSGHVEGQLLKILVSITNAKRVLEIGVFSGYSALAMAEALPSDGELVACELDPRAADFAERHLSAAHLNCDVSVKIGKAIDTIAKLKDSADPFDLVFIDADKPSYKDYVKTTLDYGLIKLGGLFVVDNTLLQGEVYIEDGDMSIPAAGIHEFNKYLTNEPRVTQVLIPLRDGVTLAQRII